MIKSFGDSETEKIFRQIKSKKLPLEIQKRALVKLLLIDSAETKEINVFTSSILDIIHNKRKISPEDGFAALKIFWHITQILA